SSSTSTAPASSAATSLRGTPSGKPDTTAVEVADGRQGQELQAALDSIDWREKGAVTPVKNQGQCRSSWAFSATGALEGLVQIKTGSLHSFSEQDLVDCSRGFGNQGCNGGEPLFAFRYIHKNGGLPDESLYHYTGRDGTCKHPTVVPESGILG